jgi:O-antigen/teichoic acid export membrane protein
VLRRCTDTGICKALGVPDRWRRLRARLAALSVLSDTAVVLAVRVGGLLLQLALFAAAAKTLPIAAVGFYAVITTGMLLSRNLGPLGLDIVLMRLPTRPRYVRDVFTAALRYVLLVNAAVGAVAVPVAWVAVRRVDATQAPWVALAVAGLLVGIPIGGVCVGVLRCMGRLLGAQAPESALQPALALGIYLGVVEVAHGSLLALSLAHLIAVAASLVYYLAAGLHSVRTPGSGVGTRQVRRIMRAARVVFRAQAATLIAARSGSIFVYAVSGAPSAALFETGLKTQLVGSNVTWATGVAAAPRFAAAHRRRDLPALQRLLSQTTTATVIPAAAVFLAILVAGKPLLGLLGPRYEHAFGPALLLAGAALVDASTGPLGYLYNMVDREEVVARCNYLQLGVMIVAVPTMALAWGGTGAAAGTLLAVIVRNVEMARLLRRSVGIAPGLVALTALVPRRRRPAAGATAEYAPAAGVPADTGRDEWSTTS